MQTGIMINKLTFGSDDAELDEKHGFLAKVFLKTSVYDRAKGSQRELVIGRKGSGKSAMCLMLKKAFEGESVTALLLTPQQLSEEKIEQLKTETIHPDDSYRFAWKYAFLVAFAQELLAKLNTPRKTRNRDLRIPVRGIRKVLIDNGEIRPPFRHKLFNVGRLFSEISFKIGNLEARAKAREREAARLREVAVPELQKNIETALQILNQKWVVLIDRVDEVWNETDESELMMIGICRAVHELNMDQVRSRYILFLSSTVVLFLFTSFTLGCGGHL